MSLLARLLSRSTPAAKPRFSVRPSLGVQRLEDRTTPTVGLDSMFTSGGDAGWASPKDIAVDAAGNTYLTGSFAGSVDFDPDHDFFGGADVRTARGARDIFVAKYTPDNTLVWVTRMGGDNSPDVNGSAGLDMGNSINLDAAGNILVAGQFYGTADFSQVLFTSAGDKDAFVAKLSPAGSVLWAQRWGAAKSESASGIAADAVGYVYVTGYATNVSGTQTDVMKFTAGGSQSWVKSFQTNELQADLAVDPAGNVYVAGAFDGTVDFDPATNRTKYLSDGTGQAGTFVMKLTTAGNLGWVSAFQANTTGSISGYAYAYPKSIALDAGNNVVVGGYYSGVVDFDPGSRTYRLPDNGSYQGYVAKLNSSGGFAWANALASMGSSMVHGVAVDAAGSVYTTGVFQGTVDLDPSATGTDLRTTTGSSGTFVVKYTASGGYGWGGAFVSSDSGVGGFGIAVDAAGTISVAGHFQGTTDFDPDPFGTHELTTPIGQPRLYVTKLRQS